MKKTMASLQASPLSDPCALCMLISSPCLLVSPPLPPLSTLTMQAYYALERRPFSVSGLTSPANKEKSKTSNLPIRQVMDKINWNNRKIH